MTTPKQELQQFLAAQPDDATKEQLLRELAFALSIDRSLADYDRNQLIDNEAFKNRISLWN